jgi:hypothetical protein
VIFVCKKCKYVTKNIKDIENHVSKCDVVLDCEEPVHDDERTAVLMEEKKAYQVKAASLESKLERLDLVYRKMKVELKLERLRSKVYGEIIKQNMGINLCDVIRDTDSGLHVYNVKGCKLDVIVHNHIISEEGSETTLKLTAAKRKRNIPLIEDDCKKVVYRSVKNMDLVPEPDAEEEPDVEEENVDEPDTSVKKSPSPYECKKIINNLLTHVQKSRTYNVQLSLIKTNLLKVISLIEIDDYRLLLLSIVAKLTETFTEKGKTPKKIVNNIEKCFTPLDLRIVQYGDYTNITLEMDDLQRLRESLDVRSNPEGCELYDASRIYTRSRNYGLSMFPLSECLRRVLICKWNFFNIVYVKVPKATEDDPYSFYTLEHIHKNGLRNWKMDCRLDGFTSAFATNVLPYCISLFRKLYMDVFGDNDYRENYSSQSQSTEYECEQLLLNIFTLADHRKLCNTLRDIVRKSCTIAPTKLDKFNLYGDDTLLRRQFEKYEHRNDDVLCILKSVFDDISTKDATKLYLSKI